MHKLPKVLRQGNQLPPELDHNRLAIDQALQSRALSFIQSSPDFAKVQTGEITPSVFIEQVVASSPKEISNAVRVMCAVILGAFVMQGCAGIQLQAGDTLDIKDGVDNIDSDNHPRFESRLSNRDKRRLKRILPPDVYNNHQRDPEVFQRAIEKIRSKYNLTGHDHMTSFYSGEQDGMYDYLYLHIFMPYAGWKISGGMLLSRFVNQNPEMLKEIEPEILFTTPGMFYDFESMNKSMSLKTRTVFWPWTEEVIIHAAKRDPETFIRNYNRIKDVLPEDTAGKLLKECKKLHEENIIESARLDPHHFINNYHRLSHHLPEDTAQKLLEVEEYIYKLAELDPHHFINNYHRLSRHLPEDTAQKLLEDCKQRIRDLEIENVKKVAKIIGMSLEELEKYATAFLAAKELKNDCLKYHFKETYCCSEFTSYIIGKNNNFSSKYGVPFEFPPSRDYGVEDMRKFFSRHNIIIENIKDRPELIQIGYYLSERGKRHSAFFVGWADKDSDSNPDVGGKYYSISGGGGGVTIRKFDWNERVKKGDFAGKIDN